MVTNDSIERKLDILIALTRIGIQSELRKVEEQLRADPVSLAILRNLSPTEAISAGALKTAARAATKQSEATIKRRLADLVTSGAVLRRGSGAGVSYLSSGLFEV